MLLSITAGPDVVGYGRMFNCGKDEYLELDPAAPLVSKKIVMIFLGIFQIIANSEQLRMGKGLGGMMPLTLTFDYGFGLGMMFGELDLAEPGYCHRVHILRKYLS